MKLLTFLGATEAYETAYVMADGQEHTAPYCGVALAYLFPNTSMRVFVTKDARRMHLERFRELIGDCVDELEAIDISDGTDETELWQIFQAVVDAVEEGEQIVFDVTHGFRSLPFLSFLAAAYLRIVKRISLHAVLYGNFEARDKSVTPNRAPIVELTSFVGLLDWMVAADRFIRFGDARDLAELLRATSPGYKAQRGDPLLREQAKRIRTVSRVMDEVSRALRLIRPSEAMDASEHLQTRLLDAIQTIQAYARPFVPLSRQVTDAYAPLALGKAAQEQNPVIALARERRMVQWYLERGQYVQAVALAREWIISWAMLYAGVLDLLKRESREKMEQAFGGALQRLRERSHGVENPSSAEIELEKIPQIESVLELYNQLGDARNDLLHAGKRPSPRSAQSLEGALVELCSRLENLPLPVEVPEQV